jgi:hypothetical protein
MHNQVDELLKDGLI